MKVWSSLAAVAIIAVLCAVAVLTTPKPLAWYDMVIVLMLAAVPALLVVLMSIDTHKWDAPGIGFAIVFTGIAMLYSRVAIGIYQGSWLQSDEALWMIRGVLIAGLSTVFIIFIDQVFSHERSLSASLVRVSVLGAAILGITGTIWIAQWVDWRAVWEAFDVK